MQRLSESTDLRRRYPDSGSLLLFEEQAICATASLFVAWDWRLRSVVDQLLILPYYLNPSPATPLPARNLEGTFSIHYQHVPYTALQVHRLWRTAHYLECAVLLRHLWETMVQMPFFYAHPQDHARHLLAKGRNDRVTFKKMFEYVAPGSYEIVYGQLSVFAHGSANFVFRTVETSTPNTLQAPVGTFFSQMWAKLFHLHLVGVLRAYITWSGVLFPENTVASNPELERDLHASHAWLTDILEMGRSAPNPDLAVSLLALGNRPSAA